MASDVTKVPSSLDASSDTSADHTGSGETSPMGFSLIKARRSRARTQQQKLDFGEVWDPTTAMKAFEGDGTCWPSEIHEISHVGSGTLLWTEASGGLTQTQLDELCIFSTQHSQASQDSTEWSLGGLGQEQLDALCVDEDSQGSDDEALPEDLLVRVKRIRCFEGLAQAQALAAQSLLKAEPASWSGLSQPQIDELCTHEGESLAADFSDEDLLLRGRRLRAFVREQAMTQGLSQDQLDILCGIRAQTQCDSDAEEASEDGLFLRIRRARSFLNPEAAEMAISTLRQAKENSLSLRRPGMLRKGQSQLYLDRLCIEEPTSPGFNAGRNPESPVEKVATPTRKRRGSLVLCPGSPRA